MLYRELLSQEADILCLQEVDRLEKLLPVLEKAGYSHRYASGPRKKHGCLIAFKKDTYEEVGLRLVHYDDEEIRSEGSDIARKGASFRTKNIGHIVALRNNKDDFGLVVATTHLFWHPRYTYERARQAGILKREVVKFREELGDWPCIISGDFNFAPDDAGYSLIAGDPLLPKQLEDIRMSQVVHATVDPTVTSDPIKQDENENEEETDPDRSITNARIATPTDGLLSSAELHDLFANSGPPLTSAYDIGMKKYVASDEMSKTPIKLFGDRSDIVSGRHGAHEPQWTSYTHYWKTVLDYIFVIDTPVIQSTVTGVLAPHQTEDLEPGLPRKGVCASDHVSLSAEVIFQVHQSTGIDE
ncbi:RNA exonuclease ngl2, variant 2 [Stygiomarasmius scandens]